MRIDILSGVPELLESPLGHSIIKRAKERTQENADKIEYKVVDATDKTSLLALGKKKFDAAVCTMALMDMSSIEPIISTLPKLLKVGGRFVFSVPHPLLTWEHTALCRTD
jgi:2-polyprenyl-3-methyl-5-hydroxy-6-metoxy-1,4-benzoquinol methylase